MGKVKGRDRNISNMQAVNMQAGGFVQHTHMERLVVLWTHKDLSCLFG